MLEEGWVRFGTYNGLAAQHRLNSLKDVLHRGLEPAAHGGHDVSSSEEEAARRRAYGTHGDRATPKGER